jgi:TatD DNase family protein
MFDTHCHLFDKVFEAKLDGVISDSRNVGVKYFLIPATSLETSNLSLKLSTVYQNVYCSVGIHPTENLEVDNIKKEEMILSELCLDKKVVALGETGLDYYRFKSSPEIQKVYLRMHIKLALKYEKALILHNRQSTKDILQLLRDNWQETLTGRAVFHCASFEDDLIAFANKYDCYLGVDGDITYDEFKQGQVKKVDIDKLVLETDSPYLLPEPLRSEKRYPNTPSNLPLVVEKLSNLLSIDNSNLIEKTTLNAKRLFGI